MPCHAGVAASRRTLGSSLAEGWNSRCDPGLKMTQEKMSVLRLQNPDRNNAINAREMSWQALQMENPEVRS